MRTKINIYFKAVKTDQEHWGNFCLVLFGICYENWYEFLLNFPDSGDHDLCVPFTGSEAWTRSVGYEIVDEWRPWYSNKQVAGYTFLFPKKKKKEFEIDV